MWICPWPPTTAAARNRLSWIRLALAVPALPLLLWACTSHPLEAPVPLPVQQTNQNPEIDARKQLDLLFLIDDSPSMADKQANLRRNFPSLIAALQNIKGGLPDVHIAVVTSDLGSGPTAVSRECQPGGKRGVFRVDPACGLDPGDRFIVSSAGGTMNNFKQDMATVFSCLAAAGDQGCGFEHQLQAIRVALYEQVTPANKGFLRPGAYLGIVILTDEDDCSAEPTSDLFTDDQRFKGTTASFRCAQVGHRCDGMAPPIGNFSAPLSHCQPADGGRLIRVADVIGSVRALKPEPDKQILVAAITGWSDDAGALYQYGPVPPIQELDYLPICQGANGKATAALRVRQFVQGFGNNGLVQSICADDFSPAMKKIGDNLTTLIDQKVCLDAPPVDTRPDPGLQPDCVVTEQVPMGDAVQAVSLPACTTGKTPCWSVVPDGTCGSAFRLDVQPDPPGGTQVLIRCQTCARPGDPGCAP
jgi:hypothetical protein